MPRSLRHLPHHDSAGTLDAPHVRNGLARAPQMTGVSDAQKNRAISHLRSHANAMNIGTAGEEPDEAFGPRELAWLLAVSETPDAVLALGPAKAGAKISRARWRRLAALRDELSAVLEETSPAQDDAEDTESEPDPDPEARSLRRTPGTPPPTAPLPPVAPRPSDELARMRDHFAAVDGLYERVEQAARERDKIDAFAG